MTGDLAITFKDKDEFKRKVNSDDEYNNCHKLGRFGKECLLLDRRVNRPTQHQQSQREESQRKDERSRR